MESCKILTKSKEGSGRLIRKTKKGGRKSKLAGSNAIVLFIIDTMKVDNPTHTWKKTMYASTKECK